MDSKGLSLNLVRKKRRFSDAFSQMPTSDTTEKVCLMTIHQELADATPPAAALEVFPDWRGLLIKSRVLDMAVWVVRNGADGEALARETGQPALLLDDVLRQKGKTPAESRAELLPLLITGTRH